MYFIRAIGAVSIGVIDAGSTGTRLKIFNFDENKLKSQKFYRSEQMPGNEGRKGIHNLEDKDIEKTIKYLFKTSEISKSTPVGFYGTGGLRSVSEARQKSILGVVRESAKDYNLAQNRIISGNEEALYSYKAFVFLNPDEEDYSIIDMGGKSVQIIERGRKEVKLFSLEMGVLNSKCRGEPKEQSILNSIGLSGFSSKGQLYASEIKPVFSSYTCEEPQKKKKQKFRCRQDNIQSSKNAELKDRASSRKSKAFYLKNETEKTGYDFFKVFSLFGFFKNGSAQLHSLDEKCIDDFFKNRGSIRLGSTSKIFLMSFFEEIMKSDKEKTLGHIFDSFDKKCRENNEEDCTKYYYSIKFLDKIGLKPSSKLRLVNKKNGIDISWALGMALDLKNDISE